MTHEDAKKFTSIWLPAWTGNNPEKLIEFYSDDVFYVDPAVPQGIKGREPLLVYFEKLLTKNPNWVWTAIEIFPTERGFHLKWLAKISIESKVVECVGVDIVELCDGLITRNEVYFDRSALLSFKK